MLKNTKNDDYDILYSSNTLCLNCAFVAANCVVAFDETANMMVTVVFVTTTTTTLMRADEGVQKNGGIFEKKRRFCLG